MAASFRSATANATENTSLVLTTPTGAAAGDVLVVVLISDAAGSVMNAPDGTWTAGPTNNAADLSMATFYKALTGAPAANYTFTTTPDPMIGSIACINADGGTTPVITFNGVVAEDGTTGNTPSLNADTSANDVWLGWWACDSGFTVSSAPTPVTGATHALANQGSYSLASYYINSPTGASLTRALTWSGSEALLTTAVIVSFTAAAGSTTISPQVAVQTISGRQPTHNAFNFVRIRDVLVNESGQPIGAQTNLRVMVWYGGECIGAPNVSLNAQTCESGGTVSWSIPTGTLTNGAPIFYVSQDSLSFSNYTCARLIPSYEIS